MGSLHLIQSVEDARRMARKRLPRLIFEFIDGAAGSGMADHRNRSAIDGIRLQSRVLTGSGRERLACSLLGRSWGLPFGIAPMGMCNLAWPRADRFLAAAAVRYNIPLCLSTAASTTLEKAREMAAEHAWFQLYVTNSREAALALVERAHQAGYENLLLTVDTPQAVRRPRELRSGFTDPFRPGPRQLLDFAAHPRWSLGTLRHGVPVLANNLGTPGRRASQAKSFDRAARANIDFDFLRQLRDRWRGKLIVKGVTFPQDAVRIRDYGTDAIYVSNHGGRQLDSAPAAIHLLPPIRAALGDDYPLIFDSGLRCGEGIVKALASGADFVMLGRPILYALGARGERGLNHLLELLATDAGATLAQIGCTDVAQLNAAVLAAHDPGPAAAGNRQ